MGLFDFLKPKPQHSPEMEETIQKIRRLAFPHGQKQIEEETDQLHALLRGKLSKKDAAALLVHTKAILIIAKEKSEARITASIRGTTNGSLTEHEMHLVYVFPTGVSGPITSGGDGSSAEQAVVINATSTLIGVPEEYAYVEQMCGKKDEDYTFVTQMHSSENGREYDMLNVKMKDGTTRDFWFDITSFFGKF